VVPSDQASVTNAPIAVPPANAPAPDSASGTPSGSFAYLAILGVPVTKLPGASEIELSWNSPDGHRTLARTISVIDKKFFSETIDLTPDLTALRAVPSARKEKERRSLTDIISAFDEKAVFARGKFSLPVPGKRRTSGFGDQRIFAYSDGTSERSIHYGIDFGEPNGTPILAPAAGLVVLATDREETGNTVVIEHLPGVFSILMHMSSIVVKEGDSVVTGTVVGHVGSTGVSTGPHLHWGVFVSGVAIDPDAVLGEALLDTPSLSGAQSSNGTP
jgi:murein DD-endopeptidase MepM/ murein hydrolase activator NlpD